MANEVNYGHPSILNLYQDGSFVATLVAEESEIWPDEYVWKSCPLDDTASPPVDYMLRWTVIGGMFDYGWLIEINDGEDAIATDTHSWNEQHDYSPIDSAYTLNFSVSEGTSTDQQNRPCAFGDPHITPIFGEKYDL